MIYTNSKGSMLIEFLVALSIFMIAALGLSNQLLAQTKFFKVAEQTKANISTNQDIINVYSWFRGSVDHNQALLETSVIFEDDFSISCGNMRNNKCLLHRQAKAIKFELN